jgi:hypothetical protein
MVNTLTNRNAIKLANKIICSSIFKTNSILMKSKMTIVLAVMLIASSASFAQHYLGTDYKTALGVKFYPGGISFKQNLNDSKSLEAIGYFWNGNRITGLYELNYDIEGLNGLRWYIGPGAHVSFYDEDSYSGKSYLGIDGVIGLDWKVNNAPLNLSLDWQPSFDFGGGAGFSGSWGGMSVRYVLK